MKFCKYPKTFSPSLQISYTDTVDYIFRRQANLKFPLSFPASVKTTHKKFLLLVFENIAVLMVPYTIIK